MKALPRSASTPHSHAVEFPLRWQPRLHEPASCSSIGSISQFLFAVAVAVASSDNAYATAVAAHSRGAGPCTADTLRGRRTVPTAAPATSPADATVAARRAGGTPSAGANCIDLRARPRRPL